MIPISLCVIMKNEEKNMEHFLSAIKTHFKGYPYELVLVDTGSTDRTLQIAHKYTDNVYHFEWINDFSAARNYSLSCAANDWILVLDCDEYITGLDISCFQQMARQSPHAVGVLTRKNHFEMNGLDSLYTDEVERFFNKKNYHYEGIIHEQVCRIDGSSYTRVALPLVVDHCGYTGTYQELCKKAERNNALLEKMLEKTPDDPYLYFQLGQSYTAMRNPEKACYYYGKGLEYEVEPQLQYVQIMVIGYGYALLDLGRFEEALFFENIYEEFATTADFVCLMGLIYLRNGLVDKAMEEFAKATSFDTARTEGANSYIPTYNLGCIHEVLGHVETAISLYHKCGNFKPALERLKELKPL